MLFRSARAIATAAHSPYAHYAAAVAALWTRDLDRARQEAEIALALSPNFANGQGVRGLVEVYLGNPLAVARKALERNELMNTRMSGSERALATMTLERAIGTSGVRYDP